MKKIAVLLIVALCVVAFFYFDVSRLLTLEELKSGMAQFTQWRDSHPLLVAGVFFVIYVAATALSLPGAAILTLAAGALFGANKCEQAQLSPPCVVSVPSSCFLCA